MVYVFLADGFEEIEALTPVDLMRRAGIETLTVGVTGRTVTGAHGIAVTADVTADAVDLKEAEMIVLPGGAPGYLNLEASDFVQSAVDACVAMGRYIAAICAAPTILGRKGLLKGRRATCYPGMEGELEGAAFTEDSVACDGRFITSRGVGTAIDFALKLIETLTDGETARRIGASICHKG